jgi:hypothetical protein
VGTDHELLVVGLSEHAEELTAQLSGVGDRVLLGVVAEMSDRTVRATVRRFWR